MAEGDYQDPYVQYPLVLHHTYRGGIPAQGAHPFQQEGWDAEDGWRMQGVLKAGDWGFHQPCWHCNAPPGPDVPNVGFEKKPQGEEGPRFYTHTCFHCADLPQRAIRSHVATTPEGGYYSHERHEEGKPPGDIWDPSKPLPQDEGPYTGEETRESTWYIDPLVVR